MKRTMCGEACRSRSRYPGLSLRVSTGEALTGFRVAFCLFPGGLGWKGHLTTFVLFTGGQETSQ